MAGRGRRSGRWIARCGGSLPENGRPGRSRPGGRLVSRALSTTLALLIWRYLEGVRHSEGIVWVEAVRRCRGWLA
jgi:hypothetical protein